ncbi:MAG: hypothetical protein WC144_02805 [Sulfurimonas sp.]
MGMLTKKERDALEDVFLSIDSQSKYSKYFIPSKLLGGAFGLKNILKSHKIGVFFDIFTKKKKSLSK